MWHQESEESSVSASIVVKGLWWIDKVSGRTGSRQLCQRQSAAASLSPLAPWHNAQTLPSQREEGRVKPPVKFHSDNRLRSILSLETKCRCLFGLLFVLIFVLLCDCTQKKNTPYLMHGLGDSPDWMMNQINEVGIAKYNCWWPPTEFTGNRTVPTSAYATLTCHAHGFAIQALTFWVCAAFPLCLH